MPASADARYLIQPNKDLSRISRAKAIANPEKQNNNCNSRNGCRCHQWISEVTWSFNFSHFYYARRTAFGRAAESSMGARARHQHKSAARCTLSSPHILDCCWLSGIHNIWNLSFIIQQKKETRLDSDLQKTELQQSYLKFHYVTCFWLKRRMNI